MFGDLRAISEEFGACVAGETRRVGLLMKQEKKMCARIACFCAVPVGEEFCSELCRQAGSDGMEVACECDHPACPITARQFIPSIAA